jgi:hypothetical protein
LSMRYAEHVCREEREVRRTVSDQVAISVRAPFVA